MADMVYGSTTQALSKIMQVIADASLLPNAEMEILDKLRSTIIGYVAHKADLAGQAAGAAAGGDQQQMPQQDPSMSGAGPAPGPSQISPGGGSGNSGFPMPNPDELRRVLANSSGA